MGVLLLGGAGAIGPSGAGELLHPERPTLVIAPVAVDEEVPGRVPLPLEPDSPGQGQGALVPGLDIGLHAVQAEVGEGDPDHRPQSLGHQPPALVAGEGAVPEVGGLEGAPHDVAHAHVPDQRPAGGVAGQEGMVALGTEAGEHGGEACRGVGEVDPGTVKRTAGAHRGDELVLIVRCQQVDTDLVFGEREGEGEGACLGHVPQCGSVIAMRIRPRHDPDLGACATLLTAVHAADGYPVNLPHDPVAFLAPPDTLGAWVAEDGGRLVGHVALRSRTSAPVMAAAAAAAEVGAERLAVVARLLVSPESRRRGVGRALLEAAARRALELGRRPVLDVVRSHTAAVALYDREGWDRAGEVEVTFPSGQTVKELVFLAPRRPETAPTRGHPE